MQNVFPRIRMIGLAVWAASFAPDAWAQEAATASAPAAQGGSAILLLYCLLVVLSSWIGGMLPSLVRLTHTRLQILISLIGGLMLGVGLLHQLPHAVFVMADSGVSGALDRSVLWMLIGMTVMFFLLRMFHFHQHDTFEPETGGCGHDHSHDHDHGHDHGREHTPLPQASLAAAEAALPVLSVSPSSQGPEAQAGRRHVHGATWMGVALGLSLHTLIDGLALAAHVQADRLHDSQIWLPGLGTFLGIVLHKPLDSLSIASLMNAGGWTIRAQRLVNFAYATLCPMGALLFYFGLRSFSGQPGLIVGAALAFSAGVFVCIALSDLLPEVEFHSHDRLSLSAALLAGLALAWGIGFLEPAHSHGTGSDRPAASAHDHGHDHSHDHKHD